MSGKQPVRRDPHPLPNAPREDDETHPQPFSSDSRLVALRHHPTVWLAPAALLLLALLPWPYGFYTFLRLGVCLVCAWLAYEQWKLDYAVSAWVVVLGAIALLYNPLLTVHLTREIWSVLNLLTAFVIVCHLWSLRRLMKKYTATATPVPGHNVRLTKQIDSRK